MKEILVATGLVILAGAALVARRGTLGQDWTISWSLPNPFLQSQRPSCERNGSASLKTIASAQADFRVNDRDGNGVNDFWRGDIAGLYAILPRGTSDPAWAIKLIELSVAGADDRPINDITLYTTRSPKAGYWYRAIRHADEDEKHLDPNRFAACCYPAAYPRSGRWTYIIDEDNTIYRKDLGRPGGIDVFPADLEKEGWTKLD